MSSGDVKVVPFSTLQRWEGNKTTYFQMQTRWQEPGWGEKDRKRRDNVRRRADVIWVRHARSSDEPMTTFVTCLLLSFPKSV